MVAHMIDITMNQNNSFQVLLRKSGFKPIKSNHGLKTHRCVMILGRPRTVHLEIRCAEKHSVLVLRFEGEWHWAQNVRHVAIATCHERLLTVAACSIYINQQQHRNL